MNDDDVQMCFPPEPAIVNMGTRKSGVKFVKLHTSGNFSLDRMFIEKLKKRAEMVNTIFVVATQRKPRKLTPKPTCYYCRRKLSKMALYRGEWITNEHNLDSPRDVHVDACEGRSMKELHAMAYERRSDQEAKTYGWSI